MADLHSSLRGGRPFLAWPRGPLLVETAVLASALTLWWVVVYSGADWLASWRTARVRVHCEAELQIPFLPAFLLIYRSIDGMFLLGPLVLRTHAEVRALARAVFIVIFFCGVCFVLMPAELGYPPPALDGFWAAAFALNRRIVLRYNLCPSLHVALSTVTLAAYGTKRDLLSRTLLALWCGLIALSTLLTHEHHLLDVVTGFLVGWAGYRWVYRRGVRAAAARIAAANRSSDPKPTA